MITVRQVKRLCTICGRLLPVSQFNRIGTSVRGFPYYSSYCKACTAIRFRAWARVNRDKIAASGKAYRATNHAVLQEKRAQYYLANREAISKRAATWRAALRYGALVRYSGSDPPKCVSCGFDNIKALQIDHVDGDGLLERKNHPNDATMLGLKRRGYPPGYQVLCANCQWVKRDIKQEARGKPDDGKTSTIDRGYGSKYVYKLRYQVLSHYSQGEPRCAVCGLENLLVLQLDHVSGGGSKYLHEVGSGKKLYLWIKRHDFPPIFQVLCANHNWVKRREDPVD